MRDLLTVLRAIDDPTDEVAIVAALRSPMFGCGDDDLVRHHGANGSWDYRKPPPEDADPDRPVAAGLRSSAAPPRRALVARRERPHPAGPGRATRSWSWRSTIAGPATCGGGSTSSTDQARVFTDAYGTDLRRYLAWAEVQCAEDARVVEAILPESDDDAVRIMTVHASKGLEFPIVVLSGLNVGRPVPSRRGRRVVVRGSTPEVRLSKQAATPGYEQLAAVEDTMESYEQLRLLYVAATRARDHLIVSLHHKAGHQLPRGPAGRRVRRRRPSGGGASTSRSAPAGQPPSRPGPRRRAISCSPTPISLRRRRRRRSRPATLDRPSGPSWSGPDARPRTLAATAVAKLARAGEAGDDGA